MVANNYNIEVIISITGFFLASSFRVIPSLQKIISSFQTIKYGHVALEKILQEFKQKMKFLIMEKI